jgi:pseudouridine synthase
VEERLQKLISQAGIASRRAAEQLIEAGRVTVNGKVAKLGDKADLSQDTVKVDGQTLKAPAEFIYILLYKPRGIVSTTIAQRQDKRRTVRDLVPVEGHLFTVGRLDANSEGLMLLTSDGELANQMTHPRYGHLKTYQVLVEGLPSEEKLERWRTGIMLEDKMTAPAKVRVLSNDHKGTWIEVVMREGRKRQIRDIASILGHPVNQLIRTKIDTLDISRMRPGEWRYLTPTEVRELKKSKTPKKPQNRKKNP